MKLGLSQITNITLILGILILSFFGSSCVNKKKDTKIMAKTKITPSKINVIFDTDANNELDDQHALA
jgi:hypothetical protein